MKCCKENITTPFCPYCGKDLSEPLEQLIKLVQTKIAHSEALYIRHIAWAEEQPDIANTHTRKQKRESRQRKTTKFKSWLQYLESLKKEEK